MGSSCKLPAGARLFAMDMHRDHRGAFTEVFRRSWRTGVEPAQWNVVASAAGVLRGVHAHIVHEDYLLVMQGVAQIGLKDLRRGSPTQGLACVIEMRGDDMQAIRIPRGVAHGFYFTAPAMHLYAVTHDWNPADELGCHWADPALGIPWAPQDPILSPRDANAGSLAALMRALEPHQPIMSWREEVREFA